MIAAASNEYRSIWMHLVRVPFSQGWVNAGGIRTRYVQAGSKDAPALLMLHGTAGSWEMFCANLESHAQHFNCLALDMVGCGFSERPDIDYEIPTYVKHVADFMTAVGVKRASLVGCSVGAWVAARFALTHPERTDKLTLLAAAGLFANLSNMNSIRSSRLAAVENPTWENIRPILDQLLHREENRIPDLIAVRQAAYRQEGMAKAMEHILCLQDPDIRPRNLISEEEWKNIAAPTLLVGSVDDPDEYLETARRVAKLIPGARYVEMRDVGHWPHFEDPATFNRLHLDFLLGR